MELIINTKLKKWTDTKLKKWTKNYVKSHPRLCWAKFVHRLLGSLWSPQLLWTPETMQYCYFWFLNFCISVTLIENMTYIQNTNRKVIREELLEHLSSIAWNDATFGRPPVPHLPAAIPPRQYWQYPLDAKDRAQLATGLYSSTDLHMAPCGC